MDRLKRAYYGAFKIRFLEATGQAFQDLFSKIMELKYPGAFVRIRPWGRSGDQKNDGWLVDEGVIFQVYAPNELRERDTLAKIEEDFLGALESWGDRFHEWVFVHNSSHGLAPNVSKMLFDLGREHSKTTRAWGFQELSDVVFSMGEDRLEELFGSAPSEGDLSSIGYDELIPVLSAIASEGGWDRSPIKEVSPHKLRANMLSSEVAVLLTAGMRKSPTVRQLFQDHYDPEFGERVAQAFKNKYAELQRSRSYTPDEIFLELQDFALGRQRRGPKVEAAVLAVLAYFFETCEIFEDPTIQEVATRGATE